MLSNSFFEIVGLLAGVLTTFSYFFYIRSILRGETKPSRVTWIVWSALGLVILSSYHYSGATTTIWFAVGQALGPLIVAILSIKFGVGGWTILDRLCLFGIFVCGLIWYVSQSALLALVASIIIDFFAAIPTVYKTYQKPSEENRTAWFFTSSASLLNFFAITKWSFAIVIYPVYMLIMNSLITTLVFRKKIK